MVTVPVFRGVVLHPCAPHMVPDSELGSRSSNLSVFVLSIQKIPFNVILLFNPFKVRMLMNTKIFIWARIEQGRAIYNSETRISNAPDSFHLDESHFTDRRVASNEVYSVGTGAA